MKISPYKTPMNFYKVDEILYRSSQPNEQELYFLKDKYNITDIFNVSDNPPTVPALKEIETAKKLNINYKAIPSSTDKPVWDKIKTFVDNVNALKSQNGRKALVHCNAGVDRTGTYVVFYQLINKLKTFDGTIKEMIEAGHTPELIPKLIPRIKEIAIANKLI